MPEIDEEILEEPTTVDPADEDRDLTDDELEGEELVEEDLPIPFHGVAVMEGMSTRDGRHIPADVVTWEGVLPQPFRYVREDVGGHSGAVSIGMIEEYERVPVGDGVNEIRFRGHFNPSVPETNEYIDGLIFGNLGGVSIDPDDYRYDVTFEVDEDGNEESLDVVRSARLRATTGVAMGAFSDAWIALGWEHEEGVSEVEPDAETEAEVEEELVEDEALAAGAAFAPGTKDGPGWLTHPQETSRLRRYWTKGKGAAKVRWGTPGDFRRARRLLAKYIAPQYLNGTVANLHFEATGTWPGVKRGDKGRSPFSITAGAAIMAKDNAEFFRNPNFSELTPLTITEDGRIFGHLAGFGICHIGIADRCVMAPKSATAYAHYRTGVTATDEGDVNTGVLVMGTSHAGLQENAMSATRHYDNTGRGVADIATGDDKFGIWYSGRVRPEASEGDIRDLRAGMVSGDWRMVGGKLELIAVLAVNSGGFRVPRAPRPGFAMDAGNERQLSLVAAGVIMQDSRSVENPHDIGMLSRMVADEIEERQLQRQKRVEREAAVMAARDPELLTAAAKLRERKIAAARTLNPED